MFWHPDIKTDELFDDGDLERDVLLQAAGHAELYFVAQDTVEAGEHLLCRKFLLVVCSRNLKGDEDVFGHVERLGSFVVAPREV